MPPQQKTIALIKCCKVLKQFTLLPTKLQCIETLYSPFYKVTNSLVREANIVAVRYCGRTMLQYIMDLLVTTMEYTD